MINGLTIGEATIDVGNSGVVDDWFGSNCDVGSSAGFDDKVLLQHSSLVVDILSSDEMLSLSMRTRFRLLSSSSSIDTVEMRVSASDRRLRFLSIDFGFKSTAIVGCF
jgi:hypothetical protein